MLDSVRRKSRFREIVDRIKREADLSIDFDTFGENLNLDFDELLFELRNRPDYELDLETCVELVDLILFDEKNGEKSTISRLQEKYDGYSDFMLGSYMKLGLEPNDILLEKLIEFDLDHGFTVDQLVTSGWFYYRRGNLIEGLEEQFYDRANSGEF